MNGSRSLGDRGWMAVLLASLVLGGAAPAALANADQGPVNQRDPLNHPPSAQAGAPIIVIDGGPNDEDGEVDGDANVELDGTRSSDWDEREFLTNETVCNPGILLFGGPPFDYDWFEGTHGGEETPVATGENPRLFGVSFGFQEYTLEVTDRCNAGNSDHIQAFVGTSQTELARWSFDTGLAADWTTRGITHTTDGCEVDAAGSYLAFNLGTNATGACTYESQEPVQGTAVLQADPRNAEILALEFSTRFDTREGVGTLEEELFGNVREDVLTVEASFDNGQTWTEANHTFSYDRMDADLDSEWVRAGGIYDLSAREVTADEVLFRFSFDSVTASGGGGFGWLVDDVRVSSLRR